MLGPKYDFVILDIKDTNQRCDSKNQMQGVKEVRYQAVMLIIAKLNALEELYL